MPAKSEEIENQRVVLGLLREAVFAESPAAIHYGDGNVLACWFADIIEASTRGTDTTRYLVLRVSKDAHGDECGTGEDVTLQYGLGRFQVRGKSKVHAKNNGMYRLTIPDGLQLLDQRTNKRLTVGDSAARIATVV